MVNPVMADASRVARCPICGAADSRLLRRGYYHKCPSCKVAFRELGEPSSKLDDYWQEEFWSEREVAKRKNREPVFRDAFRVLNRLKPAGGSVLDIGCGIGTFLAVCREGGWSVTGVEPSAIACRVAKGEYGLDLIDAPFSSALFSGRRFDAVFAAQVIHHLPDPVSFVEEIDRVLANDGIVMLRTPNLIALEPSLVLQRLVGRERGFFCGPALYAFHPKTLALLFHRLGYRHVTFLNSRPYLELPRAPWRDGGSIGVWLKGLAVAATKLVTYGAVQAVNALSRGRLVIGPSILVVAHKKAPAYAAAAGSGGGPKVGAHMRDASA